MKLDLEEKDLLNEIVTFKIINKNDIAERYNFVQLQYILKKINNFLRENKEEIIYSSNDYIYYFGDYNEKIFELESEEKKLKKAYRQELIELFLLFNDKKLTIYRIIKKLNLKEDEKNKIKRDVEKVLSKYNTNYLTYKNSKNNIKLFETEKIEIKKIRENFLEQLLLKRLKEEKVDIYSENFYIKNLEITLDLKNIKFIQKTLFSYMDKYTNINSTKEKYKILTKFLMNLKIKKYRIEKSKFFDYEINQEYHEMIRKILKKEKIRFYPRIVKELYKKLKPKLEKKKSIIEDINNKLKQNIEILEDKIEFYEIKEKRKIHNNEEFVEKQIKKIYIPSKEVKKIKTLVLIDVEESNIFRIFLEIQKIATFLEVIEVIKLNEFKRINKTEKRYNQVLIISTSNKIKKIKNFSQIPIYLLNVENFEDIITPVARKYYLIKKVIELKNLIEKYQELITEKKKNLKAIKKIKRRKLREKQKIEKLLELKDRIKKMKNQK